MRKSRLPFSWRRRRLTVNLFEPAYRPQWLLLIHQSRRWAIRPIRQRLEVHISMALGDTGVTFHIAVKCVAVGCLHIGQRQCDLKTAFTGPTLARTDACKCCASIFSKDSQPGILACSIAGSFSACQTEFRSAPMVCSPRCFIASSFSSFSSID